MPETGCTFGHAGISVSTPAVRFFGAGGGGGGGGGGGDDSGPVRGYNPAATTAGAAFLRVVGVTNAADRSQRLRAELVWQGHVFNPMSEGEYLSELAATCPFIVFGEQKGAMAPGTTQSFRVTFSPPPQEAAFPRRHMAHLRIHSELASVDVPIIAEPVAAELRVPTLLDFGSAPLLSTSVRAVPITNPGALPLLVTVSMLAMSADFGLALQQELDASPPGGAAPTSSQVTALVPPRSTSTDIVAVFRPMSMATITMDATVHAALPPSLLVEEEARSSTPSAPAALRTAAAHDDLLSLDKSPLPPPTKLVLLGSVPAGGVKAAVLNESSTLAGRTASSASTSPRRGGTSGVLGASLPGGKPLRGWLARDPGLAVVDQRLQDYKSRQERRLLHVLSMRVEEAGERAAHAGGRSATAGAASVPRFASLEADDAANMDAHNATLAAQAASKNARDVVYTRGYKLPTHYTGPMAAAYVLSQSAQVTDEDMSASAPNALAANAAPSSTTASGRRRLKPADIAAAIAQKAAQRAELEQTAAALEAEADDALGEDDAFADVSPSPGARSDGMRGTARVASAPGDAAFFSTSTAAHTSKANARGATSPTRSVGGTPLTRLLAPAALQQALLSASWLHPFLFTKQARFRDADPAVRMDGGGSPNFRGTGQLGGTSSSGGVGSATVSDLFDMVPVHASAIPQLLAAVDSVPDTHPLQSGTLLDELFAAAVAYYAPLADGSANANTGGAPESPPALAGVTFSGAPHTNAAAAVARVVSCLKAVKGRTQVDAQVRALSFQLMMDAIDAHERQREYMSDPVRGESDMPPAARHAYTQLRTSIAALEAAVLQRFHRLRRSSVAIPAGDTQSARLLADLTSAQPPALPSFTSFVLSHPSLRRALLPLHAPAVPAALLPLPPTVRAARDDATPRLPRPQYNMALTDDWRVRSDALFALKRLVTRCIVQSRAAARIRILQQRIEAARSTLASAGGGSTSARRLGGSTSFGQVPQLQAEGGAQADAAAFAAAISGTATAASAQHQSRSWLRPDFLASCVVSGPPAQRTVIPDLLPEMRNVDALLGTPSDRPAQRSERTSQQSSTPASTPGTASQGSAGQWAGLASYIPLWYPDCATFDTSDVDDQLETRVVGFTPVPLPVVQEVPQPPHAQVLREGALHEQTASGSLPPSSAIVSREVAEASRSASAIALAHAVEIVQGRGASAQPPAWEAPAHVLALDSGASGTLPHWPELGLFAAPMMLPLPPGTISYYALQSGSVPGLERASRQSAGNASLPPPSTSLAKDAAAAGAKPGAGGKPGGVSSSSSSSSSSAVVPPPLSASAASALVLAAAPSRLVFAIPLFPRCLPLESSVTHQFSPLTAMRELFTTLPAGLPTAIAPSWSLTALLTLLPPSAAASLTQRDERAQRGANVRPSTAASSLAASRALTVHAINQAAAATTEASGGAEVDVEAAVRLPLLALDACPNGGVITRAQLALSTPGFSTPVASILPSTMLQPAPGLLTLPLYMEQAHAEGGSGGGGGGGGSGGAGTAPPPTSPRTSTHASAATALLPPAGSTANAPTAASNLLAAGVQSNALLRMWSDCVPGIAGGDVAQLPTHTAWLLTPSLSRPLIDPTLLQLAAVPEPAPPAGSAAALRAKSGPAPVQPYDARRFCMAPHAAAAFDTVLDLERDSGPLGDDAPYVPRMLPVALPEHALSDDSESDADAEETESDSKAADRRSQRTSTLSCYDALAALLPPRQAARVAARMPAAGLEPDAMTWPTPAQVSHSVSALAVAAASTSAHHALLREWNAGIEPCIPVPAQRVPLTPV